MKKNENYPKYVQAMRLMDEGMRPWTVSKKLHMGLDTVRRIRQQYLLGGELALLQPSHVFNREPCEKEKILLSIKEKGLPLREAAVLYNVPGRTIRRWQKAYEQSGLAGLSRKHRENTMRKKRQRTEAEMDELERLRKRNEYLEAENALLKKVKALVEEREARLREIGRKPSKD